MADVYHALGLHLHQPPGNLLALHNSAERWEAKQILWCYDRLPRMLDGWRDCPWLHLSLSGTLLKQLEDPAIQEIFADVVDIPDMLHRYRHAPVEVVGSGLYHPVYPLIPSADWDAQTEWWQGLGRHLLGRPFYPGFWPPEMGFCPEMIPMLRRHGYRYVLVDCWYIKPRRDMAWHEMRYQPFWASHEGARIIVIPRDRELSDAQESGMDPGWFEYELAQRTRHCDFPALVTTWTDGENGGWYRMPEVEHGFWGVFFHPILARHRAGELAFTPIHISQYLDRFEPREEVDIHPGAWNTGDHWGGDFTQWTGSLLQKRGYDELRRASTYYHQSKARFEAARDGISDPEAVRALILRAYDHLLEAETSCNFFWGSHWVHRSFDHIEQTYHLLDVAAGKMPALPEA